MAMPRSTTIASLIVFYSFLVFFGFTQFQARKLHVIEQEQQLYHVVEDEEQARVVVKNRVKNRVGKHGGVIIDFGSATELEPTAYYKQNVLKNEAEKPIVLSPSKSLFISSSLSAAQAVSSRIYRRRRRPAPPGLDSATAALAAPGYPPLASLIGDTKQRITGDVQFLLDYSIIGFAKCGTTTLSKWLDTHPEISDFPHEVWDINKDEPANLVKRLYEKLPYFATNDTERKRGIRGYKCPGDITRPVSLEILARYWPKTKLIISLRHPVSFFESFYNYRVSLEQFNRIPGTPNELIGPEQQHDILATAHAAFHVFLASLGKTNMSSAEEKALLTGFYKDDMVNMSASMRRPAHVPNQIFLMETAQLADNKNETRSNIFRQDLESFLGLSHPLVVDVPVHRPNAHIERTLQRKASKKRSQGIFQEEPPGKRHKIDICSNEHIPARQELMRISRAASRWIREYFLHSPDVFVSSPQFFDEIIQSWMQDPCDKKVDTSTSSSQVDQDDDDDHEDEKGNPVSVVVGQLWGSISSLLLPTFGITRA